MVARNPHLASLQGTYLFPEIARRKNAFLKANPHAQVISLGIGDTTEPLPSPIIKGLHEKVDALGTAEGYSGYGTYQGEPALREKIASAIYPGLFDSDEIFISDGSKCDIGRLGILFGSRATVALQDPSYPVYVDASVMLGQAGTAQVENGQFLGLTYLPCAPAHGFFPHWPSAPRTDLIYFCSPNNPTGAAATREQLTDLVAFAQRNRSIILYDAVYASFIRDDTLPKTIFEIPGAREVAIELGSFSKIAGFTGVRLGWTVVPKTLAFDDGSLVAKDWLRVISTVFNAASNIAQAGGVACLEEKGLQEIRRLTDFYLENAATLRNAVEGMGLTCYGGENAPYLWVDCQGRDSWDMFDVLLREAHIVSTPGSGFGPSGQGFIRLSAFGSRPVIKEAARRLGNLRLGV